MNILAIMAGVAAVSAIRSLARRTKVVRPTPIVRTQPVAQDVALEAPPASGGELADLPTLAPAPAAKKASAAPTRARRQRTQQMPDIETFSDLLERLDDSFASLRIPPIQGNWLPKEDIRALHKMGIHVPTPWAIESPEGPVFADTAVLPNMASAHMMGKKWDTEDKVHPRFIFAIRADRLPPNVEQFAGTPYRFGMSVELHARENDEASPMRSFWIWAWAVVGPDGLVRMPFELRPASHTIRHRRTQGPNMGCKSSFVSRTWERPSMLQQDDKPLDEYERFLKLCFRQLLKWWTTRPQRWSVAVKKDGYRVTFSIQPEHTSAYFADRDKSVKAADGTAKKIIHYVQAHTRSNGSAVREHIRGLREFDWHGYSCAVTAPKFTGALATAHFDIPPLLLTKEEERAAEPGSLLTMEAAAQMMAEGEDRDIRRLSR